MNKYYFCIECKHEKIDLLNYPCNQCFETKKASSSKVAPRWELKQEEIMRDEKIVVDIKGNTLIGEALMKVSNVTKEMVTYVIKEYGKEAVIFPESDTCGTKRYARINGYTIMTLEEYLIHISKPEPLFIWGYEVKYIDKRGFNIGSQRVSWEIFDKIAERRPKE
jgi:hypothetical protein